MLTGDIVKIGDISSGDAEKMFRLLSAHFDGVLLPNFLADLKEKHGAIILRDKETGEIAGFSTLLVLETAVDGEQVKAVFSGDTIVERSHWGETELGRLWLKFVFDFMESNPGGKLYWFLISQGYRTYSYLPNYFNEFYPRHDKTAPPFEQKVLDALASEKFPGEYDAKTGIIRFKTPRDHLKPELSQINEKRLKNPHVRFFAEKNPFHHLGDELACIAPLAKENFKPVAYRVMNWKTSG